MRVIHDKGFSTEDFKNYKKIIFENILNSVKTLLEAMKFFNLKFSQTDLDKLAQSVLEIPQQKITLNSIELMTPEMGKIIKLFWSDKGFQQAFELKSKINLNDSCE
jgi:hypothetical protein